MTGETDYDAQERDLPLASPGLETAGHELPLVSPSASEFTVSFLDVNHMPLVSPDLTPPLTGWTGNSFGQQNSGSLGYGEELLVSPDT